MQGLAIVLLNSLAAAQARPRTPFVPAIISCTLFLAERSLPLAKPDDLLTGTQSYLLLSFYLPFNVLHSLECVMGQLGDLSPGGSVAVRHDAKI